MRIPGFVRGRLAWAGGMCSLATPRGASRASVLVSREQITRAMGSVPAVVSGPVTVGVGVLGRPVRAVGALARSGVAVASTTVCWRRAAYNISGAATGCFPLTRRCSSVWGSGM